MQPALERGERARGALRLDRRLGGAPPLALQPDHREDQAAVIALELGHPREARGEAELLDVAGEDPRLHRVDEHRGGVLAEVPARERRERLVDALGRPAREQLSGEAQLRREREQLRLQQRRRRARHRVDRAVREEEPVAGAVVRGPELRLEPERGDQPAHRRLAIEPAVRPGLGEKALLLPALDRAARREARLDHLDVDAPLEQLHRRRQSRDPCPDDSDLHEAGV